MTTDDLRRLGARLIEAAAAVEAQRAQEADPSLCLRAAKARLELATNYLESAIVLIEAHQSNLLLRCAP